MLSLLKARFKHGYQAVPDDRTAMPHKHFRGFPLLAAQPATQAQAASAYSACPAQAFNASPLSIDMGRCHFCGNCAEELPLGTVTFTNNHHIASSSREHLVVAAGTDFEIWKTDAVKVRQELNHLFGRSFRLRNVSAAGCNACEFELNATNNVNFDMSRFGIDIVASPRHADGVIVTGPVSANMASALEDTWEATPAPKILIVMGACAISGGLFGGSPALERRFFDRVKPDLYIPGCPPHPLTVINGILKLLDIRHGR